MDIIIATNNPKKLLEMERILAPLGYSLKTLKDVGFLEEIEETGTTFAENARIKALAVHKKIGGTVIADDSGLVVDALGGAPGVYSARYGGEDTDYPTKIAMLLADIEKSGNKTRAARFESAVHIVTQAGREATFYGSLEGEIGFEPKGAGGFGYDPILFVGECSVAELTNDEKDKISHRGRAMELLKANIKSLTAAK